MAQKRLELQAVQSYKICEGPVPEPKCDGVVMKVKKNAGLLLLTPKFVLIQGICELFKLSCKVSFYVITKILIWVFSL